MIVAVGDTVFTQLHRPLVVAAQRTAGLRFGEPRAQALFSAFVLFRLLPIAIPGAPSIWNLVPTATSAGRKIPG